MKKLGKTAMSILLTAAMILANVSGGFAAGEDPEDEALEESVEEVIDAVPEEEPAPVEEQEPALVEEEAALAEEETAPAEEPEAEPALVEEISDEEEEPSVEDAVPVEETVVEEEAPAEDEPPIEEEPPAGDEAPIEDESPIEEEAPAGDEAPIEDESPIEEEAPTGDVAPIEDEPPIEEEAPAGDVAPIAEEAPAEETAPMEDETPIDVVPAEEPEEIVMEVEEETVSAEASMAIDGGTFYSVDWVITDDGVLQLGNTGTNQNFAADPALAATGYPWLAYADDIRSVEFVNYVFGSGSHAGMFAGCSNLTTLDLNKFETNDVTSMNAIFQNCSALTELDLSTFNTANVADMSYMFDGCSSLTSLDLTGLNTAGVESMVAMFRNCSGLTAIDLSGFTTTAVTAMDDMFAGCSGLTTLDLRPMTMGATVTGMLSGLTSLTTFICDADNIITAASGLDDPGYTWSLNTGADYAEGTTYSAADLMAELAANPGTASGTYDKVYVVTFDGNGAPSGTMPTAIVNMADAAAYTLPDNGFTVPTNKEFKYWEIDGTQYEAGNAVTLTDSVTAAAVWDYTVTWNWAADHSTATADIDGTTVDAEVTVEDTAACETAGTKTYTATIEYGGNTYTDTHAEASPATGHDWGEPAYAWAADNSTVTATRVCGNDASHTETETVESTSAVTTAATCETKGVTTYTATFTNTGFTTQTATAQDVDALGHDWGEPTYAWAADNSTVTATRVCGNDASHTETETVESTSAVTTAATCETKGVTTYTATFTNAGFTTQTATAQDVDALGHDWGEPSWIWAKDHSSATAVFTCGKDDSHTKKVKATVTSKTTDPTCTKTGKTVYTAAATLNGTKFTDKQTETIAAAGHEWGDPSWTWAKDHSSATAVFTCGKDDSHTKKVKATVTSKTTDPTCTKAGKTVYTAAATLDGTKYTDKQTETIAAAGHEWGEPSWTWAKDHSSATAVFTCEADPSHQKTVAAEITTVDTATCEKAGTITYTAKAVLSGKSFSDKRSEASAAMGHEWDNGAVTKQATCIEDGVRTYTCRNDRSHTYTETVPATGHDWSTAWSSDGTSHWHVCRNCGERRDEEAHTYNGPATVEADEACTVCGYVRTEKLYISSSVGYRDTGDMILEDRIFVQETVAGDTYSVILPEETPTKSGFFFEGWLCSRDERMYDPGTALNYGYEEIDSVTFTGIWTQIIGIGTYDLNGNTKYRFAEGTFRFGGDDTVYEGEQYFYLSSSGNYTITNGR